MAFCAPDTVLLLTSFATSMPDAQARFATCSPGTTIMTAAATTTMSYTVVCAPFGTLCASKKLASPSSTMGLAIYGPSFSTLLTTRP
uniref:Uncharacterized protein n=1 Tax=Oryza meridionalis TaxID=40149 RepID=A0A0E0C4S8_9ORYZ